MEESVVPAEEFGITNRFYMFTGKMMYVKKYKCPKKTFWNNHDTWWDYLTDDPDNIIINK